MQTENNKIEVIPSTKYIAKSETSKEQGLSTDNDLSEGLSMNQEQLDIFDCSISVTNSDQGSEKSKTIQLPTIVSFKSKLDQEVKQSKQTSSYDEEMIKKFITTRVCQHSKKIGKDKPKAPKSYQLIDKCADNVQIISKCGKLAEVTEVIS